MQSKMVSQMSKSEYLTNSKQLEVREHRKKLNITPYIKQIDTLAAEYPAQTNYFILLTMEMKMTLKPLRQIK